jgi:hypothetical protein
MKYLQGFWKASVEIFKLREQRINCTRPRSVLVLFVLTSSSETFKISRFMDSFIAPNSKYYKNWALLKLGLFQSTGEVKGTPALLSPLERANLNQWSRDDGQGPQTQ